MSQASLIDPFAREITYLRLSVTDRCDFRCAYCLPEHANFLPKRDVLTIEELEQLAFAFIDLGVEKIRITGGEPLVRRGIMQLFERLGSKLEETRLRTLALTTNASQLSTYAKDLAACGVKRVNISLDTLDPEKFKRLTRRDQFKNVRNGIDAARQHGMDVKINTVALRGFNDDEFIDLIEWCAREVLDLCFIELMPMGEDFADSSRLGQYFSLLDLREQLETLYPIEDIPLRTGGPARYVRRTDTGQTIGFITPLSHNFCESCNRIRVSCTGDLYTCLGHEGKISLRETLRTKDKDLLRQAIIDAIKMKPKGHDFDYACGQIMGKVSRSMSHTGG